MAVLQCEISSGRRNELEFRLIEIEKELNAL